MKWGPRLPGVLCAIHAFREGAAQRPRRAPICLVTGFDMVGAPCDWVEVEGRLWIVGAPRERASLKPATGKINTLLGRHFGS